ncbi:hypothetical protein ACQQ2N_06910 [Dokdonella sp. MW10]|uniref:hypothetical protein n=1 Tax=Dokdonella sp. MW10 TaxID=2992926 RepID=UPI003F7CFDF6
MISPDPVESSAIAEEPQFKYLPVARHQDLSRALDSRSAGLAILLDIIGSTRRKQTQRNWQLHTECLYEAFSNFCKDVSASFESIGSPIVKFVGDGLLAYFPLIRASSKVKGNVAPPSSFYEQFVHRVIEFREMVHDSLGEKIGHVRLKAVVAFLNDIAVVGRDVDDPDKCPGHDVLGRGIDFLFRLEKFAGSSHVILNAELARATTWASDSTQASRQAPRLMRCERNMRGWEHKGPQDFFVLVSPAAIRAEPPPPSPNDEHVTSELLRVMIDCEQAQDANTFVKPQWGFDNPKVGPNE